MLLCAIRNELPTDKNNCLIQRGHLSQVHSRQHNLLHTLSPKEPG